MNESIFQTIKRFHWWTSKKVVWNYKAFQTKYVHLSLNFFFGIELNTFSKIKIVYTKKRFELKDKIRNAPPRSESEPTSKNSKYD